MFVAPLEMPDMTVTDWRVIGLIVAFAMIFVSVHGLIRAFREKKAVGVNGDKG